MTSDRHKYRSELPEDELFQLWMKLKQNLPILYHKFMNPNYDDPDIEDELRSVGGGVSGYIRKLLPDMPFHPDRLNVYRDMTTFAGRYLVNGHKEEWPNADRNGD